MYLAELEKKRDLALDLLAKIPAARQSWKVLFSLGVYKDFRGTNPGKLSFLVGVIIRVLYVFVLSTGIVVFSCRAYKDSIGMFCPFVVGYKDFTAILSVLTVFARVSQGSPRGIPAWYVEDQLSN